MAFDFAPVISAAGSLISSALSSREAKKQREWQEAFYQHRHQWEVQDLKAAGLNPILSVNSAGSVPSGSTGQVSDLGTALSQGMNTAQMKKYQNSLIENQNKETASRVNLNTSQENKNNAEANLMSEQVPLVRRQVEIGEKQMDLMLAQTARENAVTAKEKQMVDNLVKDFEIKNQQLEESKQRVENLKNEIQEINSRIAKNYADAERARSDASLNYDTIAGRKEREKLDKMLAIAENNLKYAQERLYNSMRGKVALETQLTEYSLPKARNNKSYYENPLGQFYQSFGNSAYHLMQMSPLQFGIH